MSPWRLVQAAHWGWKAGFGVVGGLAATAIAVIGWASGPIETNAIQHDSIYSRIQAVEQVQDTIKSDLGLVRCWVRHEIQQTDATACLVEHR